MVKKNIFHHGAHLQNIEMINAQLAGANLSYANLTNANGKFVNLNAAILAGADLRMLICKMVHS
jgi:uncharacterized protein YjbI with pentapeptide repeats